MKQFLIGLGVGTLIGGAVGYFLAKKNGEAAVQKEIEDARERYAKKLASLYAKESKETPTPEKKKKGEKPPKREPVDYTKFASKDHDQPIEGVASISRAEKPSLEDLVSGLPDEEKITIVSEEFNMENEDDFEQTTLVYYTEDDVLVDEDEEPISERGEVIGDYDLISMSAEEPEEHIVYFRNPQMKTIFEVVFAEMSYAREVLGVVSEEGDDA